MEFIAKFDPITRSDAEIINESSNPTIIIEAWNISRFSIYERVSFIRNNTWQRLVNVLEGLASPDISKLDFYHSQNFNQEEVKELSKYDIDLSDYISLDVKHFFESKKSINLAGVTWVIWSWKSYIINMFNKIAEEEWIEFYHIDLDKIWHEILSSNTDNKSIELRNKLIWKFWNRISDDQWFIIREELSKLVFSDINNKHYLDSLIIPLIGYFLKERILNSRWFVLVDWALIIDNNLQKLLNNNLLILDVSVDLQKERLINRWYSGEKIQWSTNSQLNYEEKLNKYSKNKLDEYWNLFTCKNDDLTENDIRLLFNNLLSSADLGLEIRIKSLLHKLWISNNFFYLYSNLRFSYNEEWRYYHNWQHIIECVDKLYEIKESLSEEDFIKLFLAILFHDIFYSSNNKYWENEKRSAELFKVYLDKLNIDLSYLEDVYSLIITTIDHDTEWKDIKHNLISDIDFSVFARDRNSYINYIHDIQLEYSHIDYKYFVSKRIEFLKKLKKRKSIFITEYFHSNYESQAISNINYELNYLQYQLKGL